LTNRVSPQLRTPRLLSPRRAAGRLLISAAVGVITFAWFTPSWIEWPVRAIAGWDATSLALLGFSWTIILTADAKETRRRSGADDPGRHAVFAIALVASLISLFAATVVLREVKAFHGAEKTIWTVVILAAIALSWAVTHTAFTLMYAHLLYRGNREDGEDSEIGLQFCGTDEPSDIDFAYFAFTIGMCFQVSDVVVRTTQMRWVVLLHAVLSFGYNTAILALALNVVFGLVS